MIETREDARRVRAHMKRLAETQTDEDALDSIEMFRAWRPDTVYYLGERLQHKGKLYKVNQPELTSSAVFPPDAEGVTALYSEVTPPDVIAEWKQPEGAHDAYQVGDKVRYNGHIYVNQQPNNIYPPDVYGWELVE